MALALPAIISNITTPLLGLIDVAIVGHFGAASYLGAIAVGTTMFNMIYWLFAFLRMGTAGIAAQAHGADNLAEASATLRRGLLMAATFGSLMIALAIPLYSMSKVKLLLKHKLTSTPPSPAPPPSSAHTCSTAGSSVAKIPAYLCGLLL